MAEAIDFCDFYAAEMRLLGKPAKLQIMAGETNVQHRWPRGVCVVISPWNFPLAILCGTAGTAVAGGNTVLLKPSNNTPVIAAELVRLCIEAGFPPGVINLVTGRGSERGERLACELQPRMDTKGHEFGQGRGCAGCRQNKAKRRAGVRPELEPGNGFSGFV